MMIYLDYSATTPVAAESLDVFVDATRRHFANPNSLHAPGIAAAQAVAQATNGILTSLGAVGYELIYTSGATEANNLAIKG
ncbi:MAG: aminotransferase class V-fold PLP-dependent enzyme, partial [bacterium]